MKSVIEEMSNRNILKKTIPVLIEWAKQFFNDIPHPDTGVGGDWDKFFSECRVRKGVYQIRKPMGIDLKVKVVMEITFMVDVD